MSETIDDLKERARLIESNSSKQSVSLDIVTFEKVVAFIEAEGCTLQEGLRRAVRMGVEALLLERTEVPASYVSQTFEYPQGEAPSAGRVIYPYLPTSEPEDDELGEGNFSRKAPPGLA
jgi:hypothetical protein